jgi:hypothetical protein
MDHPLSLGSIIAMNMTASAAAISTAGIPQGGLVSSSSNFVLRH